MKLQPILMAMNDATDTTLFCVYCVLLIGLTDLAFRERKAKKPTSKDQEGDRK